MKRPRPIRTVGSLAVIIGVAIGLSFLGGETLNVPLVPSAHAAGGKVADPNGTAPDRYVYYPGTEELGKDEIRMIACGTGLPAARRDQVGTCWLLELGNGDKFLFDIGSGSMANVAALMIPYDMLDKVFLSHLHTDHWGDMAILWAGGWSAGRTVPLKVWGPSGHKPEFVAGGPISVRVFRNVSAGVPFVRVQPSSKLDVGGADRPGAGCSVGHQLEPSTEP